MNRLQALAVLALAILANMPLPLPASAEDSPSAGSTTTATPKRRQDNPWLWRTPAPQTVPTPKHHHAPTDVDAFLLARLETEGLKPAPRTDDRTWLRRVHFALVGLPPSPDAIRAFVDDASPSRYERAVDALLASPHFGERWARHWMDLVRYAESRGHESDFPIPNAWQYRDYLIRAFNADVPYDRFVAEHVAGDLIPARTDPATGANESVVATGWAFLGEEVHSPVDIRQDECERVDNKIDVLGKAFLGLTVACARCHDHKFDPITQRDYYALSGFVLGSSYRQVRFDTMEPHANALRELEVLRAKARGPIAAAFAARVSPGLDDLPTRLLAARDRLASDTPGAPASDARADAWLDQLRAATTNAHHFLRALVNPGEATPPKSSPPLPVGARVLADFGVAGRTPWKTDGPGFGLRPRAAGEIVLGANASRIPARVMPYGAAATDVFWNRLDLEPGTQGEAGSHGATQRAGRMLRTPTFELTSGKLHYLLRGKARVYAGVDSHIMVAGPLHGGLVATFDVGPEPKWVTHDLSAYGGNRHRAHVEFAPEGPGDLDVLLVVESEQVPEPFRIPAWQPQAATADFASSARALTSDLREALRRLASDTLTEEPRWAPLADWILRNPTLFASSEPSETGADTATADYLSAQATLAASIPWSSRTAVSWMDGSGVDDRVLIRGKPTKPGDVAPRALPAVFGLPVVAESASSGRAELARQLTDPANPLVARVWVNRLWQHVFGRGIVATPDNFGELGERPTHPELLDHLAWNFVRSDAWSTKRMLRRLVLTDTFARSSRAATGRAAEVDPGNTLLHRMPVRRLEGEAIRDAILTVSGRLDARVGGPPVPVHLTEFIVGRGRPDQSGPLDGDGRRSVYTAVPRNFLPTMMTAFDFPTPFSTVGRRNTTNVPGQPLVLMNDPFVHDQARFWAARLLRSRPDEADDRRVARMFEEAYARPPGTEEVRACLDSLAELRSLHAGSNASAWSDLAHALFNANEFIYLN
ncbi:MAG: DUF1553 domain-containing protein [Verrucomicrobiales bacterium]|nr:DUF1553 domain-containing protein [Verrucomicrobiales bacterium]